MVDGDHKVSNISSNAIFAVRPITPISFLISTILCLSMIMVDLKFNTSSFVKGYFNDVLKPLYVLTQLPMSIKNNLSNLMTSREELRVNLENLNEENTKLKLINSQLLEISRNNQELDLLWNSAQIDKESYSLGRKRSLSINPFKSFMVLEVGFDQSNFEVNQVVLSNQGIIGKVSSVGISNVEVMLVHDPRSMVPIISSSSRIHGILQGRGLYRQGKLLNIKKTAKFKKGESLYSSGLGNIYPPNFLVGKIMAIQDKADSEFLEVEVKFLDFPEDKDFFLIFTG